MQKPSNTKASAQRQLWIDALFHGWTPPPANPRTLARWAAGQAFIPFGVLQDMTATIAAHDGPDYNPEYFAKPRLPAKESANA